MSWRQQLRRATFRGLEFDAVDLSTAAGKRLTVHEYPHRKPHLVEEMGPKPRSFTMRAFICGSNYQDHRDALDSLLSQDGPGELIHPWRGTLQVIAQDWTITDSAESGGACTVDMSFLAHQALTQPLVVIVDAQSTAQVAADDAVAASDEAASSIPAALAPGGQPPLYRSRLSDSLALLDLAWAGVLGIEPGWLYDEDGFSVYGAAVALSDATRTRPILRAILGPVPASSPSVGGRYDSVAAAAFADAVQSAWVAMLARASLLVVDAIFPTRAEASEVLGMFAAAYDQVRAGAPDPVDDALAELQAVVTDILSEAIERSPRIASVTVADTTPAIVLAWQLYADPTREAEIIALNSIANPATLYGGYEVLT